MLNVQISLPSKTAPRTKRLDVVIDSGASRCMFPAELGRFIGLDIEKGYPEETLGIQGPTSSYLHDIWLHAPGGVIAIRAGFSDALPVAGLLGMEGFFDHHKILFDGAARAFQLERIYKA